MNLINFKLCQGVDFLYFFVFDIINTLFKQVYMIIIEQEGSIYLAIAIFLFYIFKVICLNFQAS